MAEIKSAIQEVRDQLFLDRADGKYLSRVSANIGIERPQFGFSNDSLWRAVVRRGALDYLQIANLFEDWLTLVFGPRVTAVTILAEEAEASEDQLTILDQLNIPQRGTMVIDEGLATEQTFEYTFRDPKTGLVDLSSSIATAIPAVATKNASGDLLTSVTAGATSLVLVNSAYFPTAGFPYTLLLSPGTANEEVVQLTGHTTATNTLTCSATVNAHAGLETTYVVSELVKSEGGDSVIKLVDTSNFPASGVVRVREPGVGGVFDVVSYYLNEVEDNVLYLQQALTNVYTLNAASVTLLRAQSTVHLAQVQVKGAPWDIFETEARKIKIYIPRNLSTNRLLDVSYLHDDVGANPSSTLSAATLVGDTELPLADASTFPSAGAILINSGGGTEEKVGYNRVDRFSTTLLGNPQKASGYIQVIPKANINDGETFTLDDGVNPAVTFEFDTVPDGVTPGNVTVNISGATTAAQVGEVISAVIFVTPSFEILAFPDPTDSTRLILVNDEYGASRNTTSSETVADATFVVSNMTGGADGVPAGSTEIFVQDITPILAAADLSKELVLSRGLAAEETVFWSSIDQARNKITLATALSNEHAGGGTVEVNDPNILYLTQGLANAHALGETVALDEDEYAGTDLEIGDPTVTPADPARFQGPYVYYILARARDSQTFTTLAEDLAGPVKLSVDQVAGTSTLEVPDAVLFDTTGQFDIAVGRSSGASEIVDVTGITFRTSAAGMTLSSSASIGDTSISMSAVDVALLPSPGGPAPYGFRLLIDRGGANEEIVIVSNYSGTLVTLVEPCTNNHVTAETVELLADVFELSESLEFNHNGIVSFSERKTVYPSNLRPEAEIHRVEELRTSIQVNSTVGFPAVGGYVIVNFGREWVKVKTRLAAALAATGTAVVVEDSSSFPTAGYPYFIEIDINTNLVERKGVTNNVPNTLTISPGADYAHPVGAEVRFDPGDTAVLQYSGLDSGPARLVFSPAIRLEGPLLKDSPVALSSVPSVPSTNGYDYPFYLPSTWADRLQFLFDRGRAAGVEIVAIEDK